MSRELDAKVAEKVLGWTLFMMNGSDQVWSTGTDSNPTRKWFEPSSSANDDYEVLKHLREKWDQERFDRMVDELESIWHTRRRSTQLPIGMYEPGDYSKAALKALGEEASKNTFEGRPERN